jgi:hypothetical protein
MPEKGHKLDMVQALLGSFGAWKPGGRFHGAQGWKRLLGIWAFCCAPLLTAPTLWPSPSHSYCDGVRLCGRNDEVSARREGILSRLLNYNTSRNSASAPAISRVALLHFTPIRLSASRRDPSSTSNSFLLLAAASACPAVLCCDSAIRALSQYLDQYKYQCSQGRRLTRRLSSQWLLAAVPWPVPSCKRQSYLEAATSLVSDPVESRGRFQALCHSSTRSD